MRIQISCNSLQFFHVADILAIKGITPQVYSTRLASIIEVSISQYLIIVNSVNLKKEINMWLIRFAVILFVLLIRIRV